MVGETAARRLWPGENALGKRLLLRGQKDWRTIGLLGVVGLEASSRRHELAIRAAMGAERQHLIRCVLMPVAWPGFIGMVVGVLASVLITRTIHGLLFGVHLLDPLTWATVLAMIVSIVSVASYVQARRAAAVDPLLLIRRV